jgi:rod shape determining protein RodA
MARIERRLAQHYEWWLLGLIVLLVGLGLANLLSATHPESEALLSPTVRRQLAALALGAIGFTGAVAIDYRHLERWAPILYAATLLLLGVTLALAPVTRGNQSWLVFGPIRLQPSELARVGMVVMLARWFHRNSPGEVRRLRDLLQPGLIAGGTVGLIILQRDMGVAILTLAVACTYLLFVRIPLRSWAAVAGTAVAVLAVVWFFALAPIRRAASSTCSIPRATRSRPAIRRTSRASRSGRAACSARATWRARRPSCASCRPSTPTSSSRCSRRSGAWSAPPPC